MTKTQTPGESSTVGSGKIIHIVEGQVHEHLGKLVTQSVEETLNTMLDAEADQALQRHPLRAQPTTGGQPSRTLQAQITHPCWGGKL